MALLLKITDGLMKGAEVALLPGTRITLGSDENGDIVIPDSTLPPVVCSLDIAGDKCAVILPDGSSRAVPLYTIQEFNGLAFAIGPAEGAWEELKRPEPVQPAAAAASAAEPEAGKAEAAASEAAPGVADNGEAPEAPAEDAPAPAEGNLSVTEAADAKESKPFYRRPACVIAAAVLLLLIVIGALLFWRHCRIQRQNEAIAKELASRPTIESLAQDYGMTLLESDGKQMLKGNFQRRTERLAIRTLALTASPEVLLDLTDDQSLAESADALLYTLTEGRILVDTVANRVVTVTGDIPDEEIFQRIRQAFRDDLPAVERLEIAKSAQQEMPQEPEPTPAEPVVAEEPPPAVEPVPAEATSAATPEPAKVAGAAAPAGESPREAETPAPAVAESEQKAPEKLSGSKRRDYPVAGILTVPYPCVVLRDGTRCTIGAQIGTAVIEKIEAERLTLREKGRRIVWTP